MPEPNEDQVLDQLTEDEKPNLDIPQPKPPPAPDAVPEDGPAAVELTDDRGEPVAKPDPSEDLTKRLQELEEKLANEEKRRTDTQAAFHRANNEGQIARQVAEAMQNTWAQQQQYAQQAQQMQPPSLESYDGLYDDGQALAKFIQDNARWAMGATLAQMYPYLQDYVQKTQTIGNIESIAREQVMDRVENDLSSAGYDDFGEYRDQIVQGFEQYGDQGRAMLYDPNAVKTAYLGLRVGSGKIANGTRKKDEPPDVAPAAGGTVSSRSLRDQKLQKLKSDPLMRQIQKNLGLDKLSLTESDLDQLNLGN